MDETPFIIEIEDACVIFLSHIPILQISSKNIF